jgi:tetratricopeptide (TPR) repeat protein
VSQTQATQALLRKAGELRAAGRFAEAADAYESVLAVHPDLPDSWYNLGFVRQRLGRFEAALAAYRQALDRGVAQPEEAHLNCGVIYADHLRRDDAAEAELAAALALNPAYVPALINLANLHEDRGRRSQAASFYEKALACDPACWEALARLAGVAAGAEGEALIARLEQALARADIAAADRASLGFALGKVLDARASYDPAFAAYAAANAASRRSAPGKAVYDHAAHERLIAQLIDAFPLGAAAAPAAGPAPLFICGMFRSGSTLTEQVLSAHRRVTAGGELALIPGLVRGELEPFPQSVATTSDAAFAALAQSYRDSLAALFPGADIVTDKRPDNFLYIGLIKRLFPNARIIHTTRDPLDNCLSIYFLHLDQGMAYALDLADIGHHYRCYLRLMSHWKRLYGADILDFAYDDFVAAPRPSLERLLDFCGLDWDENCLAFHRAESSVKTASVWQVREPLYRRSSGRWRNYAAHLGPLRAALGELA